MDTTVVPSMPKSICLPCSLLYWLATWKLQINSPNWLTSSQIFECFLILPFPLSIAHFIPCMHLAKLMVFKIFWCNWVVQFIHSFVFRRAKMFSTYQNVLCLHNLLLVKNELSIAQNYHKTLVRRRILVQTYKEVVQLELQHLSPNFCCFAFGNGMNFLVFFASKELCNFTWLFSNSWPHCTRSSSWNIM